MSRVQQTCCCHSVHRMEVGTASAGLENEQPGIGGKIGGGGYVRGRELGFNRISFGKEVRRCQQTKEFWGGGLGEEKVVGKVCAPESMRRGGTFMLATPAWSLELLEKKV